MPSTKRMTVFSSYDVVNDDESHRPKLSGGGSAGRPVSAVYARRTPFASPPPITRKSSFSPGTLNCTFVAASVHTSNDTGPGSFTSTP